MSPKPHERDWFGDRNWPRRERERGSSGLQVWFHQSSKLLPILMRIGDTWPATHKACDMQSIFSPGCSSQSIRMVSVPIPLLMGSLLCGLGLITKGDRCIVSP